MPNIEYDEPLMKVCAVWLFADNADNTRIKLWSQILKCPEKLLKLTIENVRYLENNKRGTPTEDPFLKLIYNELKDMSVGSIKIVFNGMRGKGLINI